jgi:hypothetical protein
MVLQANNRNKCGGDNCQIGQVQTERLLMQVISLVEQEEMEWRSLCICKWNKRIWMEAEVELKMLVAQGGVAGGPGEIKYRFLQVI